MSQDNYTPLKKKNKHLTEKERYEIEFMLKEKYKTCDIANRLGKSIRTIQREINRGIVKLRNSDLTYRYEYCADTGQMKYNDNLKNKGAEIKILKDFKLKQYIEKKIIQDNYSPDAVIGEIKANKLKFEVSICTKTLYNTIDKGVFEKLTNKYLSVKNNIKRSYNKIRINHKNLRGTSIEDRPEHIENRIEYGHWEMDCVIGKKSGKQSVLLVLTERKTRKEIIRKMDSKTQQSVKQVLDNLEEQYTGNFKEGFKTITVDNGVEFLDYKGLEASIIEEGAQRTKIYYAHPYSSWERGTNENTNKLIRRFIPKGVSMNNYTDEYIQKIENWINRYPRRIFNYKSAEDIARKEDLDVKLGTSPQTPVLAGRQGCCYEQHPNKRIWFRGLSRAR